MNRNRGFRIGMDFPLGSLEPAWFDRLLIEKGATSDFEFSGDLLVGFRTSKFPR